MRTARPVFLLSACVLAACQGRVKREDSYWSSPDDALRAANPSDIAILPAIDGTEKPANRPAAATAVPLDRFRQAAYRELLKRRYAPLSPEFVDRAYGAAEASGGRGQCDEDAYLRIWVTRFDTSRLAADHEVVVGADFLLNDGKTGAEIWSAKAERRIDLGVPYEVVQDETILRRAAIDRFVEHALRALPAREVRANPR